MCSQIKVRENTKAHDAGAIDAVVATFIEIDLADVKCLNLFDSSSSLTSYRYMIPIAPFTHIYCFETRCNLPGIYTEKKSFKKLLLGLLVVPSKNVSVTVLSWLVQLRVGIGNQLHEDSFR